MADDLPPIQFEDIPIDVATLARKWSIVLNGAAYNMEKFKAAMGSGTQAQQR